MNDDSVRGGTAPVPDEAEQPGVAKAPAHDNAVERHFPQMPVWHVTQWFNTAQPIQVDDLRGRVVVLHTFQMLCPGCVLHGIPQAKRVWEAFSQKNVAVIGLHTVFEHHEAMRAPSLEAFLHEFRVQFPVGIDEPLIHGGVPKTMAMLGLEGTPTLLLLDRQGRIRLHHFGQLDDLQLGAALGRLIAEPS